MSFLKISVASAATLLSFAPSALAGFDATASNNVAVYWGMFLIVVIRPLEYWNEIR